MTTDRKDLRIQAYKERLAQIVTEYEEKVAHLRVELTLVTQEKEELAQTIESMYAEGLGEKGVDVEYDEPQKEDIIEKSD